MYDDGTWSVYEGEHADGKYHGPGVYMNSVGYELAAVWENGQHQVGEWIRVDPDGAVESGRVADGECVPN